MRLWTLTEIRPDQSRIPYESYNILKCILFFIIIFASIFLMQLPSEKSYSRVTTYWLKQVLCTMCHCWCFFSPATSHHVPSCESMLVFVFHWLCICPVQLMWHHMTAQMAMLTVGWRSIEILYLSKISSTTM